MKWVGLAFAALLAIWYVVVCFASVSYDPDGNKVAGWRRLLRFIGLLPL